jgi:hypothetical protein
MLWNAELGTRNAEVGTRKSNGKSGVGSKQ